MSDILEQINSLTEQFSNLFEVEGLGDPASDVPPSTNKIKQDRKTKNGKVEVVSVEDELFPYDGNKREQYRQKIIDTINAMIQGTATLEDLLQIVRQKKMPVKEGFEGAIEILENLYKQINKKFNKGEVSIDKSLDLEKKVQDKISPEKRELDSKELDAEMKTSLEPEIKVNKLLKALRRDDKRRNGGKNNYKFTFDYKPVKEGFEGVIEILEQLLAEGRKEGESLEDFKKRLGNEQFDKQYDKYIDLTKKVIFSDKHDNKHRPHRGMSQRTHELEKKRDKAFNKKELASLAASGATSWPYHSKSREQRKDEDYENLKAEMRDNNKNESFEGAIEILEEIINEVSDKTAQGALDKAKERYNRKGYEASMKLFQGDSKGAIEDGNKAQDEYNKHINMQLRRAKRQGKKLVQDKNDHDSFKIEEAQELLEEIINEVSLKKWKEAAKNSYDKRKEVADKSAKKDKENWEVYDKLATEHPEDEPELYRLAQANSDVAYKDEQRAKHAQKVSAIAPDRKHSANKYLKTMKKIADYNSEKSDYRKPLLQDKHAQMVVMARHRGVDMDPVKLRTNESYTLSELFDRPDLLDDISKTLTNKTIKQHLENQVKKLLGGKKKKKDIKESFDSFEENNYNIVKLLEELINEVSDGKHRRKLEELKDGIKKAEEFKEATKDDVVKEKIDDIIIPQEHRLEVSQNKYEDRVVKRAQEEYDKNKAKKEKGK